MTGNTLKLEDVEYHTCSTEEELLGNLEEMIPRSVVTMNERMYGNTVTIIPDL